MVSSTENPQTPIAKPRNLDPKASVRRLAARKANPDQPYPTDADTTHDDTHPSPGG